MSYEEIAVRAWAEPAGSALSFERSGRVFRLPEYALVIDTETTHRHAAGAASSVRTGSSRSTSGENPPGSCLEEGLFYADELAARYPDGLRTLESYVGAHEADLDVERYRRPLHLVHPPRVRASGLPACGLQDACARGRLQPALRSIASGRRRLGCAALVRAAASRWSSGTTRRLGRARTRTEPTPAPHEGPAIAKGTLFASQRGGSVTRRTTRNESRPTARRGASRFGGHFLDLHTLAFALTDANYTLERACKAFGVEHGKHEGRERTG